MNWIEWVRENSLRHKKKLIFLGVVTGVLQYYNMFNRFSAWMKSREKMIFKLQRWILGVPNLKLLSFEENLSNIDVSFLLNGDVTYEGGLVLKSSHEKICDTFHEIDQKLFFGISFRFLSKLLRHLKVVEPKSKELKKIMDESKYNRKINRKCCGVNLKKFVNIITTMKPEDEEMSYWINRVIEGMKELENDQIEWEKKYIPIRIELIKMFSTVKNEKKELITNLLIDNPFMRIQELGKKFVKS
jgi:hypothetical protein